jgi:hypothetical protein
VNIGRLPNLEEAAMSLQFLASTPATELSNLLLMLGLTFCVLAGSLLTPALLFILRRCRPLLMYIVWHVIIALIDAQGHDRQ